MKTMRSERLIKKLGCAVLAGLVFTQQAVLAHATETNFWKDRRLAMTPVMPGRLITFPDVPLPKAITTPTGDLSTQLNQLLRDVGSVKKSVSLRSPRATVVHILDVHGNLDAQRSIENALHCLVEKGGFKVIGLEGAHGDLPFSVFGQMDSRARGDTAHAFLERLEIGGPVHFALTHPTSDVSFVGVDDAKLFKENWAVVRRVSSSAKALQKILTSRAADLEKEKDRAYNPSLRSFDRTVQAYRAGRLPLEDYVDALRQRVSLSTPNMNAFVEAQGLIKRLSPETLDVERTEFLSQLLPRLSPEGQRLVGRLAASAHEGTLSDQSMLGQLADLARRADVRFPAVLRDYLRYSEISDGINASGLVSEIQRSEKTIYATLITSPAEKNLTLESESQNLAQKLADFNLTPEEWETYVRSSNAGSELAGFRGYFEDFFALARKRDRAIAANLCAALKRTGADRAVLITGGFHSPGIQAALAENGVDVVTLTPRFDVVANVSNGASLVEAAKEKDLFVDMFPEGNVFLTRPIFPPRMWQRFDLASAKRAQALGDDTAPAAAARVLEVIKRKLVVWKSILGASFFAIRTPKGIELGTVHADGTASVMPVETTLFTRWWRRLPKPGWFTGVVLILFIASVAGAQTVVPAGGAVGSSGAMQMFDLGGWGETLLTWLRGQPYTLAQAFTAMSATAAAGLWLAYIFEKNHPKDDHDPDVPNALRLLPFLIAASFIWLQLLTLLGIGTLAGVFWMFRQRAISKDQGVHLSLMAAAIIGFGIAMARTLDRWGLVLLFLAFWSVLNLVNMTHFKFGRKTTSNGSLEVEEIPGGPSEPTWDKFWQFLESPADVDGQTARRYVKELSADHVSESTLTPVGQPTRKTLDIHLMDPTDSGALAGFPQFVDVMRAIYSGPATSKIYKRGRIVSLQPSQREVTIHDEGGRSTTFALDRGAMLRIGADQRPISDDGHELSALNTDLMVVFTVKPSSRATFKEDAGKHQSIPATEVQVSQFNFNSLDVAGTSGARYGDKQRVPFGAKYSSWILLASLLSLVTSVATAAEPGSATLAAALPTKTALLTITVGLAIVFLIAVRIRRHMGSLSPEAYQLRKTIKNFLAGTGELSEQDWQAILRGPRPLSIRRGLVHGMARNILILAFIAFTGIAAVNVARESTSPAKSVPMLATTAPAAVQEVNAFEDERVVLPKPFFYTAVKKGDVLATEEPYDPRAKEQTELNVASLQSRISQLRAELAMRQEAIDVNAAHQPFIAGFDQEAKEAAGSIRRQDAERAAEALAANKAAVDAGQKSQKELQNEILGLEKILSDAQQALKQRFQPRPVKAEYDGLVTTAIQGTNIFASKGQPILVLQSTELVDEATVFVPESAPLPKTNDTAYVEHLDGTLEHATVVEVNPNPQDIPTGLLQLTRPNQIPANYRRPTNPYRTGRPVTVKTPQKSLAAHSSLWVTVVPQGSTNESFLDRMKMNVLGPSAEAAPRPAAASAPSAATGDTSIGRISGRSIHVDGGAIEFNTSLTNLSGAAVDGRRNRLYISDDRTPRIDVFDLASAARVDTIDVNFLRQPDSTNATDVSAIAVDPNTGNILLVVKSQQRVHVIDPANPINGAKSFTMRLGSVEGMAISDGRIFVANNPTSGQPSIHEIKLNPATGRVEVVQNFNLPDTMKAVKGLGFFEVSTTNGPRNDLLLLEAGSTNAVSRLVVEGPERGALFRNQVAIPEFLREPSGLAALPDHRILILSHEKNSQGKNQLFLRPAPAQPGSRPDRGTNAPPAAQTGTNNAAVTRLAPGLYGFWLNDRTLGPILKSHPVLGSALGAALETLFPIALSLISRHWVMVLAWILINGAIKWKSGFVTFDSAGFAVPSRGSQDKMGFFLSNLVSWTSLAAFAWGPLAAIALHTMADLLIAAQASSLRRTVSATVKNGGVFIVTVMDDSRDKDMAKVEDVKRILADPRLSNYQNRLIVEDLTSEKDLPADVAVPGPAVMGNGLVDTVEMLNLARAQLRGKDSVLDQILSDLTRHPASADATLFARAQKTSSALISSHPERLLMPGWLKARLSILSELIGFWSVRPVLDLQDRVIDNMRALIFA